ncbi:helix-turn-helix transcriptional regulator [Polaromonas glacialis]|uniref:helix-turn-helix transcriptional regulator n=1 Tax=Polaromonas glacialis TaxID=866564 RepID=UPI001E3EC6D9|nr:helix-turn-helix transcriptional regulator [Polaromonas glacialis]
MNHLTRNDFASALQVLERVEAQADSVRGFAQAVVQALNGFVASELTTLSVCDLTTGQREVVGLPGGRLGTDEMECFDRHFFEHPLVRHHGFEGGLLTRRISDLVRRHDFQRSALFGGYYRRIGLEYAIVVPLFSDRRTLVSVVLNRRGLDFDERDRERLELLRPHLAFLYRHARHARAAVALNEGEETPLPRMPMPPDLSPPGLTQREAEVMHWLACGKTDAEIAALLSISPRTVQKHLEHIYVKLGVETRTAAVMRALAICNHSSIRNADHFFV